MVARVEDDLTPAEWNFTRTQGDVMLPTTFGSIAINGSPLLVTSAEAQVRVRRDRTSTLVLDLDPSFAADAVTVGDGVALDVAPGVYWWDVQVNDLTIVAGTFRVLNDVSEAGS